MAQCTGCGTTIGDNGGALDVFGTILPVCTTCLLKFCGVMLDIAGVRDPAEVARRLRVAASSNAPLRVEKLP